MNIVAGNSDSPSALHNHQPDIWGFFMTNDEIRDKILKILYVVCETDGIYGFMSLDDLFAQISADENIIEREFDYLLRIGLVERPALGYVTITTQGIAKVENSLQVQFLPASGKQKIEVHSGIINETNQEHINNPSLFFDRLAEEIDKITQIEPEKKESWINALLEMSNNPWAADALKKLLFLSI